MTQRINQAITWQMRLTRNLYALLRMIFTVIALVDCHSHLQRASDALEQKLAALVFLRCRPPHQAESLPDLVKPLQWQTLGSGQQRTALSSVHLLAS